MVLKRWYEKENNTFSSQSLQDNYATLQLCWTFIYSLVRANTFKCPVIAFLIFNTKNYSQKKEKGGKYIIARRIPEESINK